MKTLTTFSEKERQYDRYQARQEYLRVQKTVQLELEQAEHALLLERQEKEAALHDREAALQEKNAAQQREEVALREKMRHSLKSKD